jgi:hypothetical protein
MTTLRFNRDTDSFTVRNESRVINVPSSKFDSIVDQDLVDAIRQAVSNPGDVVAVSSTSNARGLTPSSAKRHFTM